MSKPNTPFTNAINLPESGDLFAEMGEPLLRLIHEHLTAEKNQATIGGRIWEDHQHNATLRTRIAQELNRKNGATQ